MAAKAKAAKGGAKAAKRNAYVQDVLHNRRVHERARTGIESAQAVYGRVSRKRGGARLLLDDRKTRREFQRALESFQDAAATVRGAKRRRRRRVGAPALLAVAALGGAGAVAANADLRRKITGLVGGGSEGSEGSEGGSTNGDSQTVVRSTPSENAPPTATS